MTVVAIVAVYLLYAFLGLLLFRLVMDYVMLFARSFRPAGAVAAALEVAYSTTDPPLRALRRIIPPLRLGRYSVDLSFIVLFFTASVLLSVISPHT